MLATTIILTALAVTSVLETLFALDASVLSSRERFARRGRNLVLGVLTRLGYAPFFAAPLMLAAAGVSPWTRGPSGHSAWAWVLDLLALDFVSYALHVAAHKVPMLWRFHAVHHLDQDLDATTALRTHFGEKVLTLPVKMLVVWALAMPLSHVASAELVFFVNGIFHHANLRLPQRLETALSYLITVPSFHAVHHYGDLPYTDSNYGFLFTFWDAILGTVSRRTRHESQAFGVNERIRGRYPESLIELVASPFGGAMRGTTLEAAQLEVV